MGSIFLHNMRGKNEKRSHFRLKTRGEKAISRNA